MSNLIISISKTKKISKGINITTSPPNNEDNKKDPFLKNDIHISNFKFTEEMLEVLKNKIKSVSKKIGSLENIIVIDFIYDESKSFSIDLFNRFSETSKVRIVLIILSQNAYKNFNDFNNKIKFESIIFQFDFSLSINNVNINDISNLNGVFYKSANVYERKKMEYEENN